MAIGSVICSRRDLISQAVLTALLIGHGHSIPHHLDRSKLRMLRVIPLPGQLGITRHGDYTLIINHALPEPRHLFDHRCAPIEEESA